jgi:lipoprotein-releasing system permease protein
MKARVAAALAWRALAPRGGGHGLAGAVAAMGLSLVPLLLVLVVSNGMIEGITRRLIEAGSYHLQAALPAALPDEEVSALAESVRRLPGVRLAFAERQGLALLYTPGGRLGLQLRAVPPGLYASDPALREILRLRAGTFDLARGSLVLGAPVAEELGVGVGDEIRLLTARAVRGRFVPRITRFTVGGLFSSGYQELDRGWVYCGSEDGRRVLPADTARLVLAVKLDDLARLDEAAAGIERVVAGAGLPARVTGWYELEENQYRSFQTTRALLILIMVLIVLVAAVNVSSALVMIVLEKRPEIAILKSMGAEPGLLASAFVAAGFLAGLLAALAGVPLGLLVAVNVNQIVAALEAGVNAALAAAAGVSGLLGGPTGHRPLLLMNPAFYLESIPVRISLLETAGAAALAIVVSTTASYLPARRAAAVKPLEVLRRG